MRKRIVSIFLCLMMCLSLLPATVFAEEETEEDFSSVYTVTAQEREGGSVVLEKTEYKAGDTVEFTVSVDEGYVLSLLDADPEVEISGDEETGFSFEMPESDVTILNSFEMLDLESKLRLCGGVAIGASKTYGDIDKARDAYHKDGYNRTVITYYSKKKTDDLNFHAGGHYIYMGAKFTESNFVPEELVTGVIIAKDCHPVTIQYMGKTYYPAPLYYESDGNLNQGINKGAKLYLYYTTDGGDEGAPVVSDFTLMADTSQDAPGNFKPVGSYYEYYDEEGSHVIIKEKQDLNEGTKGMRIFLFQKFHTHLLIPTFDANYHWKFCTECPYSTPKKEHEYKDYQALDNGYQHHVTCDCRYSGEKPHYDNDGDNICDGCNATLEVSADGYLFDTFVNAWNYATQQNHNVKITLLKDVTINGGLYDLRKGNEITVTGSNYTITAFNQYPFIIANGKFILDTNLKYVGKDLIDLIVVSGNKAEFRLDSGTIRIETSEKSDIGYSDVIYAQDGASVGLVGGSIEIADPTVETNGIRIYGENTKLVLGNTNITGAEIAVNVSDSKKIYISGGVYNGESCALHLDRGATAIANGGTFRSKKSCAITTDSGSVKNLLYPEFYYFLEDSGELLQPEDGIQTISENVCILYKKYTINLETIGNGTVTSDIQRADEGEKITLTPQAGLWYYFKEWKSEDVTVASDGTFIMPEKNVTVTAVFAENEPVTYVDKDGKEKSTKKYHPLTKETKELSDGWYVVDGDVTFPSRLEMRGEVHLILKDGCNLEAKEGIHVGKDAILSVYAQSEGPTGTLNASTTVYDNAAIGGNEAEDSGTINICSGIVKAIGLYGAGIGGGGGTGQNIEDGGTGTVFIYGGNVEAKSNYGAGIGGGYDYGKGFVTIDGGIVDAVCEIYGAAIGGGMYGDGIVNINGGIVTATGKKYAAGIGSYGFKRATGKVTITAGTIDAISNMTDGISSGEDGFIKVSPQHGDTLDVLTKNNTPILNSPFSSVMNITKELSEQKEVHIRTSEGAISDDPSNPNTGDDNHFLLWIVTFLAGAGLLTGIIFSIKKQKR